MNDLLLARDVPMLPSFFDEKKEEKLKDENWNILDFVICILDSIIKTMDRKIGDQKAIT